MERLDQKINSHGTGSDSPDWISLAGNLSCSRDQIKCTTQANVHVLTFSPDSWNRISLDVLNII